MVTAAPDLEFWWPRGDQNIEGPISDKFNLYKLFFLFLRITGNTHKLFVILGKQMSE
jgi:hypothetical protein